MRKIKCPLCGESCVVAMDNDQFGIVAPVVLWHTPAEHTGLEPVLHIGQEACLASGLTQEFACWVAEDRAAGRHLTAHP